MTERNNNDGARGRLSRRAFLGKTAAAAALTIVPRHVLGGKGQIAPSEKITLGAIGTGGQGTQDVEGLLEFPEIQIVSVCDVNREGGGYLSWNWTKGKEVRNCGREPARRLVDEFYGKQQRSGKYKACSAYADWRELLAKEDVDAVLVATPDHNHAMITMEALRKKKHVYCEKPLTWSPAEARLVTEEARKAGTATQLGNQGQAEEAARVTQEMIADGAIGGVREVQVWSPARFWEFVPYETRPAEAPVPAGLEWDLWLGPAPARAYNPAYCPWVWRNWWDFGTGALGDLGCHKLSTVFKALKLGYPTSVEASSTKINPETCPLGIIARYEFPARGGMPPVTLTWYDGGLRPPKPKDLEPGRTIGDVLYIGDKGTMMGYRLIPEKKMTEYGKPPQLLPRSPGHMKEWVDACKGGPPAGANFVDHAGLMSEVILLGLVALRRPNKLEWDGKAGRFTNDEEANKLLGREYRQGWTL